MQRKFIKEGKKIKMDCNFKQAYFLLKKEYPERSVRGLLNSIKSSILIPMQHNSKNNRLNSVTPLFFKQQNKLFFSFISKNKKKITSSCGESLFRCIKSILDKDVSVSTFKKLFVKNFC